MTAPTRSTRALYVGTDGEAIAADVTKPANCRGVIVFAHGSGSSRFSPRNRQVAAALVRAGFATVLADLLTEHEARVDAVTAGPRFDIALLAGRVAKVVDWVASRNEFRDLPIGLFGASTGAAAALVGAAERTAPVAAVVSRGGRPDLAADALMRVRAPTLLIVGGLDTQVLELNRHALAHLSCEARLEIVPGATHLFEEPGTLDAVIDLAVQWFDEHLAHRATATHATP